MKDDPRPEDCEFCYRWLRAGHPFRSLLRFVAREIYGGLRAVGAAILYRRPRWSDPRRGAIYGLLPGILAGWKATSRTAA